MSLCLVCEKEKRNPSTMTHTERRGKKVYVFLNVPADLCKMRGEFLVYESTLRKIDKLIAKGRPTTTAPAWDLKPIKRRRLA